LHLNLLDKTYQSNTRIAQIVSQLKKNFRIYLYLKDILNIINFYLIVSN